MSIKDWDDGSGSGPALDRGFRWEAEGGVSEPGAFASAQPAEQGGLVADTMT